MNLIERQTEFTELFLSMSTWQERFQYLVDLGNELPVMPEHLRTSSTQIECTSRTFFQAIQSNGFIRIQGWSNAAIHSGLIAMLRQIFDGLSIQDLDPIGISFLQDTGLLDNLTEQRKQALMEMIHRILQLSA